MKNRAYGIVKSRSRRFVGDRGGSSAVEFALVLPIFVGLTFSIVEAGWFFFVNSAVDAANAKAARLIRTGQVQNGAIDRTHFSIEFATWLNSLAIVPSS